MAPRRPGFYHLAIVSGTSASDHSRAHARRDGAVLAARSAACSTATASGRTSLSASPNTIIPPDFSRSVHADVDLKVSDPSPARRLPHARLSGRCLAEVRRAESAIARQARAGAREDRCARIDSRSLAIPTQSVAFDVHSGFRTPAHNERRLARGERQSASVRRCRRRCDRRER